MKIIGVIPARMESSRFPGKPLASLHGRPMLEHVYKRSCLSRAFDEVIVATCNSEIMDATAKFGGKAIMTANTHERASDRVAEAAQSMDADIVVLVQGDEPMTVPEMIDAAVEPMINDQSVECVNLTKQITTEAEFRDRNTIKVVRDGNGNALFMSREAIPTTTVNGFDAIPCYKQVCIISFRKHSLETYAALQPTPLEIAESVDMLRFIEHGIPVCMVETEVDTHAVDTPEDLSVVETMMAGDPLMDRY